MYHYYEKLCRDCGQKMAAVAGNTCRDCLRDLAELRAERKRRRKVDTLSPAR